jgi:hypothetical protein
MLWYLQLLDVGFDEDVVELLCERRGSRGTVRKKR